MCSIHTIAHLLVAGTVFVSWLIVSPVLAEDPEKPLVLTLEDLTRVATKPQNPTARNSKAGDAGLILVHEESPHPGRQTTTSAVPKQSIGRGAERGAETERTALTWQEEYYRLKALALRQALARGEALELTEDGSSPTAPRLAQPPTPRSVMGRSCIYDRDEHLVFSPRGVRCPDSRVDRYGLDPAAPATDDERCIFGIRGEVLHAPPGRECEPH